MNKATKSYDSKSLTSKGWKFYYDLGLSLHKKENWKNAIEAYHKAVELNAECGAAYCGLGDALFKLGNWKESINSYQKAIRAKPLLKKRVYLTICDLIKNIDFSSLDRLADVCNEALKVDRNSIVSLIALSRLSIEKKAFQKAILLDGKVIKIDPDIHFLFYLNLDDNIKYLSQNCSIKRFKRIIFHAQSGGLCNRLRTLCSCLCLRDLWNIPLYVKWQSSPECECDLENLYSPVGEDITFDEIGDMLTESPSETFYVSRMGRGGLDFYRNYLKQDSYSQEDYVQKFIYFIKAMSLNDDIYKKITDFKNKYWSDRVLGVHVRRTDHSRQFGKNQEMKANLSTNEGFFSKIDKELFDGAEKIFLATDNSTTQKEFEDKYPGKILKYCSNFDGSKLRETSVRDAIVDLYLLSSTQKIIGSSLSTFSMYAADLGGIPLIYA